LTFFVYNGFTLIKYYMAVKENYLSIIWSRRKIQARALMWKLLYQMYKQNKTTLIWVKKIAEILKTDSRTLKKYLWFRFYAQWHNEKEIFNLSKEDIEIIKETENIYKKFKKLDLDHKRIITLLFIYFSKNDSLI